MNVDALLNPDTNMLISMEDGGDLGGLLLGPVGLLFLLAAGAFVYANVVYTPEIIAANEQMRLENREIEIQKLLAVVQQHQNEDKDLEELRLPIETSFGMTVGEYVSKVESGEDGFADADRKLANILKSMC